MSKINWEDSIKIVMELVQDKKGNLYSRHQPLNEQEFERLKELPSMGMPQVAHCLLVEAIKREVYLGYYSVQDKSDLDQKVYTVIDQIIKRELPHIIENMSFADRKV